MNARIIARERHAALQPEFRAFVYPDRPVRIRVHSLGSWRTLVLAMLIGMMTVAGSHEAHSAGDAPVTPADDSVEAGFARDMMVHHQQAVEMALIVRDRSEDPLLRVLALDIMLTQQAQIGMMRGWLDIWNLSPNSSAPAMTWMGHPVEGRMPGMASPEQISLLRDLPVAEAEILFLQLMIVHHRAGVDMALAALERTDQDDVVRLAQAIVTSQENEIALMEDWLRQRGAPLDATPAAEGSATPEDAHDHGGD